MIGTAILWGLVCFVAWRVFLLARSTESWPLIDRALARQATRDDERARIRAEVVLFEDEQRAIEHHCPNCDGSRTFIECRISSPLVSSYWIPDLRFCVGCGMVMHIQESRVPE